MHSAWYTHCTWTHMFHIVRCAWSCRFNCHSWDSCHEILPLICLQIIFENKNSLTSSDLTEKKITKIKKVALTQFRKFRCCRYFFTQQLKPHSTVKAKMWDDIVYVSLLLVSIAYGKVTRSIRDTQARKWASSLFGLAIVIVVSGWHVLHPIASVIVHCLLIKFSPSGCVHGINFAVGFLHLFFFRLCGSGSGFWPWSWFPVAPSHTNAIQMIMTLKLMGLAFEVHDSNKMSKNDEDRSLEKKYKQVDPIVVDVFHYAFAHSGILTGLDCINELFESTNLNFFSYFRTLLQI